MDGYSVTEAASVLGVPTERVWELLARGILAGTPDGETGMRVFLQPRPGAPPADPLRERAQNGNGGTREPATELSPFRELLTEFRSLTERYGQALLALGEARGEVASLRSRVDVLEARIDLRLPAAQPTPWPAAPMPAPAPEPARARTGTAEQAATEPAATEEPPRRRRHRSGRPDVADIAEALARADDPSRPELVEVRPEAAAPAGIAADAVEADAERDQPEAVAEVEAITEPEAVAEVEVVAEPEAVAEVEAIPEPEAVAEVEAVSEPEGVALEPEPVIVEPAAVAPEPEMAAAEPEIAAAEPEIAAAEREPVALEAEQTTEPASEPIDETAADVAEAAGAAEPEPIPPDETLQADGDWPAAAPTIDVADAAVEIKDLGTPRTEGTAAPEAEAAARTEDEAAAPSEAEPAAAVRVDEAGPAFESEASASLAAVADEAAAPVDSEQPAQTIPPEPVALATAEEDQPSSEEQPHDRAGMGERTEEGRPAEGSDDQAAERAAAEESVAPGAPSVGGPDAAGSAYEAAVEEPDWFSEEDVGGPAAGEPYEPWGSAGEASHAEPRPSWSIWDTDATAAEPAAPEPVMEAQPGPADHLEERRAETDAEADSDAAELVAEPAPRATEAPEAQPHDQPPEEPVMWLGQPADAGGEPPEAEDAAAEMEVAATGWQPADRGSDPPRPYSRAVELPGARELEDALAALRRRVGGSEPSGPAAPPALGTASDDATTRPPGEASPAQRAYARLRRILPR